MTSEKQVQKFYTDDVTTPKIWVVLLIGRAAWEMYTLDRPAVSTRSRRDNQSMRQYYFRQWAWASAV